MIDLLSDKDTLTLIQRLEARRIIIPNVLLEQKEEILEKRKKTEEDQGLWQRIKSKLR